MTSGTNADWHFYIMIIVSVLLFPVMIRIIVNSDQFIRKRNLIFFLSFVIVVAGMMIGKYGAKLGLPWWIYYPIPMLLTVLLPPLALKFSRRQTLLYLLISFLSAPFIHAAFCFFLGWKEYMPFWNIPSLRELVQ